jgi:voltage-gated potassium channel Kch
MPALSRRGGHLVVCGDGPLSYRITEELTSRYGERVTVILPSRRRNYGPQISALSGVRVLEYPELSSQAFADADVQSARALAVLWQDDVGNLHAGLRAAELHPELRLVLAIFNRRLGERIRMFFADCTVLSGTAMSAPSFVAAALGEPAPSHVRVQRRTLYVARPDDVPAGAVICGLATPADDQASPRLLPPDSLDQADLVLAVADGTPRNPLARRRNPALALAGLVRRLVWHRFGAVFAALLTVIGIGFALLAARYTVTNTLYLGVMDLTGSAVTGAGVAGPEKVAQMLLTVDGMAFIPVITAIVVGARLTGSVRRAPRPADGHVIVVGLGNVGSVVIVQLHDLGFDVVCVDSRPDAPGARAGRWRRGARLVAAPRLPARRRRPPDRPGHPQGPGPLPVRAPRALMRYAGSDGPGTAARVLTGHSPGLASGEDSVDGDGVVHRGHADLVPGEAEVGPVDPDLGVEPYLVCVHGRDRGVEGDGLGAVADGEGAGDGDGASLAGGRDLVDAEGDVGVDVAVEEVGRAQVGVTLGDLGVDGGGGHGDGSAHLAVRGDGAAPRDLAEGALDRSQAPHALAPQPDRRPGRVQGPGPGQRRVLQHRLQHGCGHLSC